MVWPDIAIGVWRQNAIDIVYALEILDRRGDVDKRRVRVFLKSGSTKSLGPASPVIRAEWTKLMRSGSGRALFSGEIGDRAERL